jgi:hypothetical protein
MGHPAVFSALVFIAFVFMNHIRGRWSWHLLFTFRPRRLQMNDAPRITVDELKRRMEAGEDFTVIDTRNPREWAQSETMLPEAIRIQVDDLDKNLARIPKNKPVVAYCT